MDDKYRKWGRRLLWVLPALLAFYCVVKLTDFVRYRARIPVTVPECQLVREVGD